MKGPDIITDTKKIREYYEQLYANKLDKFLKRPKLPKLAQEEIDNFTRPISIKDFEFVLKNLPTKTTPSLDGFTGEFYQTQTKMIPSLHKLF